MKITKASLMMEIDGKFCAVLLDGVDLYLMANVLSELTPSKKLQVMELNEGFVWESLKEHVKK